MSLIRRNYQKSKEVLAKEWDDFESHTAWWEEEEPLEPLPTELQELLDKDDPSFIEQLTLFALYCASSSEWDKKNNRYTWMNSMKFLRKERSWLWTLYLQDKKLARDGLLKLLTSMSSQEISKYRIKTNLHLYDGSIYTIVNGEYRYNIINKHFFRYLKAIYKLAEKKLDIPVWSVLAYRFDVERSYYSPLVDAKTDQTPKASLKPRTRSYLARRSWRTLRKLGEQQAEQYVHMATELLLKYSAKDAQYMANPDTEKTRRVQSYTQLWLFNHMLYHNSTRFTYGSSTWRAQQDAYAEELPEVREEAFPSLWDQFPEQLFELLLKASASPVVHFAGRALRLGNPAFVSQLSDEVMDDLLKSSDQFRQDFAVREYLNRLDKREPNCKQFLLFFSHEQPHIRKLACNYLRTHHHKWANQTKKAFILKCLDAMSKLCQMDVLVDWFPIFETELHDVLSELISIKVLTPFASKSHPMMHRMLILLLSKIQMDKHPYEANDLLPYLQHESESIRQVAQQLLHQHFIQLSCTADFLGKLAMIPYEDNQVFVTQFFADRLLWLVPHLPQLIDTLWSNMLQAECPDSVRLYIQNDLLGTLFLAELTDSPVERVLALLSHQDTQLQGLGARILVEMKLHPESLTIDQLLQLAHNQIALARNEARNLLIQVIGKVSDEWLVHLVETDWDDTRNWTFAYLRTLSADQFTPDLIYGLLDSARKDVQAFAMQLVEIHFRDLDVTEIMLRSSESTDLFVLEYALSLAEKISWDATIVSKLELYFRTILFRVHQARSAKNLVVSLLSKLALLDKAMAEVIIPILTDVTQTGGKRDFERILRTLAQIQVKYPEINMPVELR